MPQIPLPQAVLLAQGVLRFLAFRLLPPVLEVTLSVPDAKKIAKKKKKTDPVDNETTKRRNITKRRNKKPR